MHQSNTITFADLVNQHLSFNLECPSENIIIQLINTAWAQRLRSISQTANTRLVYMFSEHSRFGHSVGVAFLARQVVRHLKRIHPELVTQYETAVGVAALIHDLGHLAPGSHAAFRTWFPNCRDIHEELTIKIIEEDPEIRAILDAYSPTLCGQVKAIINESPTAPTWTWLVISGGGWNVDRGNWCYVDSVLAGVDYGKYNIPAIVESLTLTPYGSLSFFENRLDAMMHFAVSRHALYRQVYHHRVLLAADTISQVIVKRARALEADGIALPFADNTMKDVLACKRPEDLTLNTIFAMRESWWNYHITRWSDSSDPILSDLCNRLLNRKLFKTVRVNSGESAVALLSQAKDIMIGFGYDPAYYLHHTSSVDVQGKDNAQAPLVLREDGSVIPLTEADPLFESLAQSERKEWLVMPSEVKQALGRKR